MGARCRLLDRVARAFPEFTFDWDAARGARQLYDAYREAGLTLEDLQGRRYIRLNQLKHLKIAGAVLFHSSGVRRAGRKVEYWLSDRSLARSLDDLERCVRAMGK